MPIWSNLKKNLKERVILHEVKKGDSQAFVWLYDQYSRQIFRFISIKINSLHDSEDLASEVFFRFWKEVNSSDKKIANPRGFLYQIARNLVIDYYRKKPRADLILSQNQEKIVENIADHKSRLDQKAVLESDLNQVKQAMNQVKPLYQDLIIWHYLDDFSIKEIAQILEKPENTVRVQLHRALKALKSVIE